MVAEINQQDAVVQVVLVEAVMEVLVANLQVQVILHL
jgi:hypothetical protein